MKRANGEGSIFKLSGKRRKPWAARITVGYTLEGKQQYKYLGYYSTKTEAKTSLHDYFSNPFDLDSRNTKLIDVFNEWQKATELADKTVKNYVSAFNQANILHNMIMRDIKAIHLENVIKNMSPHMQRVFKNMMNQLYIHALKYEIVDKNVIELITLRDVKIEERTPFTIEEINKLKEFKHPLNDTALILLYTGMRVGELLEVQTKNVFIDERYLIGGKKTSAGTNRIIPIHDDIFDIVKRRYEEGNTYLITREKRKIPYRSYRQIYWDKMSNALNITHTPHNARHTFATFADRCNMNKVALKRVMGHSLKDVTEHYTHKDVSELVKEINKLNYK